ncbi:MAG: GNAT family N-acetyltransferase [Planctomycetes bacterium]|nr:GNAT family N-acetyltransferase [Planctomycetota bacterium]
MSPIAPLSLSLRPLAPADLPAADALRAAAGWNQTIEDWRLLLELEPDGCFAAERGERLVGTATTTRHGAGSAWIGMVLVDPAHRRLGIATALMLRCLERLEAAGARSVLLDATPAGRPLYERLGFRPVAALARWEGQGTGAEVGVGAVAGAARAAWAPGPHRRLRAAGPADLGSLVGLDQRTFGAPREPLLRGLLGRSVRALVAEGAGGLAGFGLLRPGSRALYLGPLEAVSEEAGLALASALLAGAGPGPVFWDIPDSNAAARLAAERLGFRPQRPLERMVRGAAPPAGDAAMLFGIADPAVG